MSMDVGGNKGGVKSDINVTPLVDVMLVLLIIMMIVAPLLQKGADVRLPLAANTAEKPETQDQTVVAVDRSDRYFVNGLPVRKEELRAEGRRDSRDQEGAHRPDQGRCRCQIRRRDGFDG